MSQAKLTHHIPLLWPSFALFALLCFNGWFTPGFFDVSIQNGRFYGSLVDIVMRASPLILVSLGMTLVIATGGVDLSVGAVAALAPAIAFVALERGWGFTGALACALGAASLVGIWNGALVTGLGLQPIVATLIAMVAGRGLAQLPLDGQIVSISDSIFAFIGGGQLLGLPFTVSFAACAIIMTAIFCRGSAAGLFIEALGSSPAASRSSGLQIGSIRLFVYIVSAISAGIGGILISSNIRAVDVNNLGLYLELDAILAVVIGGTRMTGGRFTLVGTVLGAFIIQTVATTINTQGIAIESMLVVKAIVVIAICLFQSEPFRDRLGKIRTKFALNAAPERERTAS